MKTKIVGHMIVKNEERFVWYAINSVLPYLDHLIIFDTGSTDRTLDIIKAIPDDKITLHQTKSVTDQTHTDIRNKMIKLSDPQKYDWIMIVDGDEIWPKSQLEEVIDKLSQTKANLVVVRTKNSVGDLYHVLPEAAGQYQFLGKKGHLAMRFIKSDIKDLHVVNPHGGQTYMTGDLPVQEQKKENILVLNNYYIHTTHLRRSSNDRDTLKRSFKYKYELGEEFKKENLPEIFFETHPLTVPEVTGKMDPLTYLLCLIFTVPRRIRRKLLPIKSGYI
jgi:glycosyltransferase involved in cell wall biosynthesis